MSLDCVLDFLANSFKIIGGVPKEILIDNATTMMVKARSKSNKGIVNPKFQQFADDYGFKVVPCIAGRPNTKSKVENPMRVIDEIMSYNGTLNNLEELHEKLEQITNEANSGYAKVQECHLFLYIKKRKNIFPLYHKKKFVLSTRFLPYK